MLFNSWEFMFVFLPVSVASFFLLARIGKDIAASWLFLVSLYFYGLWNPAHTLLLVLSILFNYSVGLALLRLRGSKARRLALIIGVSTNIFALFYCKYLLFLLKALAHIAEVPDLSSYTLFPLGISFFTFTQISFLVDTYHNKAKEYSLLHYGLFVTFFPHLLAGPVLHHSELMPQFRESKIYTFSKTNLVVGTTIFVFGLFKKVVLADSIANYVTPVFDAATKGVAPSMLDAWCGVLSFSLQLYFDFSGYSDMAIGMSRLFGIILPLNFFSPYKAKNIIEFWRRWHMTLSRFLRDYLYFPMGGSRTGSKIANLRNVFVTMTLCGLWHGADWTFVAWGAFHGVALAVAHLWRGLRESLPTLTTRVGLLAAPVSILLTYLTWSFSLAMFRANDVESMLVMLRSLCGLAASGAPSVYMGGYSVGATGFIAWCWIVALLAISWALPNTQEVMASTNPALSAPKTELTGPFSSRLAWRPSPFWYAFVCGLCAVSLLTIFTSSASPLFLYFQF